MGFQRTKYLHCATIQGQIQTDTGRFNGNVIGLFNPPLLQLLVASLDKMRPRNAQLQVYNESALTLEKLSILKAWAEVYVVSMKNEIATYTPGPAPPCLGRNLLEPETFTT